MHKMISKTEYDMTRHVTLKNLETGTEDYCFDDSDMENEKYEDFYFMEEGKKYDCKIQMFGRVVPRDAQNPKTVLCRVVRDNVIVGEARLVEVAVDMDRYYIPRHEVSEQVKNGSFYYACLRKDLIQVDNVIHGAYLA